MRAKEVYTYLFLGLAIALASCSDPDETNPLSTVDGISIEGFLFAGEPIDSLVIKQIDPEGSAIGHSIDIEDVFLKQGDQYISLVEHPDRKGHYFQADSSAYFKQTDKRVSLKVLIQGEQYSFSSRFPDSLSNLSISSSEIALTPERPDSVLARLSWDPVPGATGYCIFVRAMGYDCFPVGGLGSNSQTALYRIHSENQVSLKSSDFTHYGSYSLYVTAINADYAQYYQGSVHAPLIAAGDAPYAFWGLFTAFNGEAIQVHVK